MTGLMQLGADYADSDDESADQAPREAQRAGGGDVSFRKLDKDAKAAYKKTLYEAKKNILQEKIAAKYVWLKCDLKPKKEGGVARGWHCVFCIDSRCSPSCRPSPSAALLSCPLPSALTQGLLTMCCYLWNAASSVETICP